MQTCHKINCNDSAVNLHRPSKIAILYDSRKEQNLIYFQHYYRNVLQTFCTVTLLILTAKLLTDGNSTETKLPWLVSTEVTRTKTISSVYLLFDRNTILFLKRRRQSINRIIFKTTKAAQFF